MALSDQDWQRILRAHQYRCFYCGVQSYQLTKDHKHPRVRGGKHIPDNIVPACVPCNSRKNARTVEEYWPFVDHPARLAEMAKPPRSAEELREEWEGSLCAESSPEEEHPIEARFTRLTIETAVLERWGAALGSDAFMVYAALCQCSLRGTGRSGIAPLTGLDDTTITAALVALDRIGLIHSRGDQGIAILQAADIPQTHGR